METIQKVKVRNMTSGNGREVANQLIVITDEGIYFQSYNSVIAFKPNDLNSADEAFKGTELYPRIILDEKYWDYSTTTGKYRNQFLGEDKATTEKKIKTGEYLLADLNA